jgi:hypothetical protein
MRLEQFTECSDLFLSIFATILLFVKRLKEIMLTGAAGALHELARRWDAVRLRLGYGVLQSVHLGVGTDRAGTGGWCGHHVHLGRCSLRLEPLRLLLRLLLVAVRSVAVLSSSVCGCVHRLLLTYSSLRERACGALVSSNRGAAAHLASLQLCLQPPFPRRGTKLHPATSGAVSQAREMIYVQNDR